MEVTFCTFYTVNFSFGVSVYSPSQVPPTYKVLDLWYSFFICTYSAHYPGVFKLKYHSLHFECAIPFDLNVATIKCQHISSKRLGTWVCFSMVSVTFMTINQVSTDGEHYQPHRQCQTLNQQLAANSVNTWMLSLTVSHSENNITSSGHTENDGKDPNTQRTVRKMSFWF